MRIKLLFLLLLLFCGLLTETVAVERSFKRLKNDTVSTSRTALVIGNALYLKAPLKNPGHDAEDMAKTLKTHGFDVKLLLNAGKEEMQQAISEFGEHLHKKKGVGLFYYAGHGMQINGMNYMIPLDALMEDEDEVRERAVNANSLLSKMENASNEMNIVFLDACRDNPFYRGSRGWTQGLAQMDAPKGTLIVYATSPGKTAADGKGRNGIFTQALLENLKIPDMEVEQMLKQVKRAVTENTLGKQIPWSVSSITGNFYFNPTSATTSRKKVWVAFREQQDLEFEKVSKSAKSTIVAELERGLISRGMQLELSPKNVANDQEVITKMLEANLENAVLISVHGEMKPQQALMWEGMATLDFELQAMHYEQGQMLKVGNLKADLQKLPLSRWQNDPAFQEKQYQLNAKKVIQKLDPRQLNLFINGSFQ